MRAFLLATAVASALAAGCCCSSWDPIRFGRPVEPVALGWPGEPFFEYRFEHRPKPVLYPILAPGGGSITRAWPVDEAKAALGEARDHPHHQSLWFAHGDVNGHDFWSGRDGASIVHLGFERHNESPLRSRNAWVAGDGTVVLTEERALEWGRAGESRWIDFELALVASEGPVTFGDTKEGTFALRLAPTLRLSGEVARGEALNSEGVTGKAVWGKRARWVAYWGPLTTETGAEAVCVAILDHPSNPRHPTWWHARDYGLFAANPFGAHDFEGAPEGTGDLHLERGERLELRYRLWIRAGAADAAELERAFAAYAATDGSVR